MYNLELEVPNLGSVFFDNSMETQMISIPAETELKIFKQKSVIAPSFANDFLGMYTFADVDQWGYARFGSFSTPKHSLKKRSPGCTWDPKSCGMKFNVSEIHTCAISLQMEQCPDFLWDKCWEHLLGVGNGKNDLESTTAATMLMMEALDNLHTGVGNDYWNLVWGGQHSTIYDANEHGWYKNKVSQKEWDCFFDQQTACGGLLTTIDGLKDAPGLPQFNVPIYDGEVDGENFVGSAMKLFDRLISNQTTELRSWGKSMGSRSKIIAVSKSIFEKYQDELTTKFNGIPQGYYLTILGTDYGCDDCAPRMAEGVLMYKGYYVVCMDAWCVLDDMTCTVTHRALLLAPGVLGIAFDVDPRTSQHNGFGMRVTKRLAPPFMGKTYFDTTFRVGAFVADPDYMVNACYTVSPPIEVEPVVA